MGKKAYYVDVYSSPTDSPSESLADVCRRGTERDVA